MTKSTNLLAKYLGLYEKNPTSLVFAPLAETYRKLNMHKEAFEVLKKGLRHQPHYVLGLIVLAHCHFDKGNLEQSYKVLAPIASQELDNLMLQKLYAQVCYKMYAYKESLQSYKNVLYVNPNDKEAIEKIKELEDQEQNYSTFINSQNTYANNTNEVFVEKRMSNSEDLHEWKNLEENYTVPKEINHTEEKKVSEYLKNMSVDQIDSWSVKQWSIADLDQNKNENNKTESPKQIPKINSNESNPNINLDSYQQFSPNEEVPIVTHTLIDIFFSQKHYEKAKELLEKVLKNDPNDDRSKQKYQQVLQKIHDSQIGIKTKQPKQILNASELNQNKPTKNANTAWNESKYNLLSNRYGKLLNHLKDIGKSH